VTFATADGHDAVTQNVVPLFQHPAGISNPQAVAKYSFGPGKGIRTGFDPDDMLYVPSLHGPHAKLALFEDCAHSK
jgi:hypothetical protein